MKIINSFVLTLFMCLFTINLTIADTDLDKIKGKWYIVAANHILPIDAHDNSTVDIEKLSKTVLKLEQTVYAKNSEQDIWIIDMYWLYQSDYDMFIQPAQNERTRTGWKIFYVDYNSYAALIEVNPNTRETRDTVIVWSRKSTLSEEVFDKIANSQINSDKYPIKYLRESWSDSI